MRQRCRSPSATGFHRYGGRGITVCERWDSFELFVADMGAKPSPAHTLDRKDNDGPYSPDNCRWATRKQQARNVERNLIAVVDGKPYLAVELADVVGIASKSIQKRASKGLPMERVMSPLRREMPDNFKDMQQAGWAARRSQTHCKRGHEFTAENTYFDKRGSRCCRACVNAKTQAWRDKIRSQGFDPSKPAALRRGS
jgi:hypothetical protein